MLVVCAVSVVARAAVRPRMEAEVNARERMRTVATARSTVVARMLATSAARREKAWTGAAYAALSKVLNDQGKYELADKAMAKATRVYNDGLAKGSLF